ncbi:uridine 5'-monophosphate synthase [Hyalella azteca]|uniref:Uridine 5'-monophosphate synthase n=1 Tax=Hyalella azteca TaxID=294128 RepID=A0A8B7PFP3_HYAAZ|nr:uridine 5'-monophosphate synthase [Hyalella azteca]
MEKDKLEECILQMHEIGVLKFGDFTLKSGMQSPVYFDMRIVTSYPKLLKVVSELLWCVAPRKAYDHICGVAYTGIPLATVISQLQDMPMLVRRKESKNYGTKQLVEGVYRAGQSCLIVEDVLVSGTSVYETVETLRNLQLNASDAVVFLDRQQGGACNLHTLGVNITPVVTLDQMLEVLKRHGRIQDTMIAEVQQFIRKNNVTKIRTKCEEAVSVPANERLIKTFELRADAAVHPLVRSLLGIVTSKRSNLCVSADVSSCTELLTLAQQVGPHICLLKTHVDTLPDFSDSVAQQLRSVAQQHNFLLFEDSKFVDIGATVARQWERRGAWADIVTVVPIAGDGLLTAIAQAALDNSKKGVILVAEMSSDGALRSAEYQEMCRAAAKRFPHLVMGFVSQSSISQSPWLLQLSPGVSVSASGDALGQRYVSPECSVGERGADVIIVGRGVTTSSDPAAAAANYQQLAYSAYLERVKRL